MLVHFFEVRNCTFERYKGGPVLFAPGDIDYDTLMKRGFRRSKEERWFRPVNMKEYSYIVYWAQYGDVDIIDVLRRISIMLAICQCHMFSVSRTTIQPISCVMSLWDSWHWDSLCPFWERYW